ncbi:MAG TPA: lysophospholipid acyltransferase family protein [Steroidobacter sp.]|nr:lysophospholipid acyltransferase family protein [Steroidobacter sp.]
MSRNASRPPRSHRSRSQRRLTPARMLAYRMAVLLAAAIIEVLWRTGRIRIIGGERLEALLREHGAVTPVFWHQHLLICSRFMVAGRIAGMKPGFMISPSVDGQAPTMLALLYGAHVVRGSGSYTGVRAVRGVHQAIVKEGISPAITPDGPRGPRFVLKPGAIFVAQITGKPVVPIAYAASPARKLKTWDKFIIPAPFAKICIAIGEPYFPPPQLDEEQMESAQRELERRLLETYRMARRELEKRSG